MTILLATHNQHKRRELEALLSDRAEVSIITLDDLDVPIPEPEEDGVTLEANAYIKAREIFERTGVPTLADDTGLEVAALDGAPGVRSARYASDSPTYAENCEHLLAELGRVGAKSPDERAARFRTVICYHDGLRTLFAEGEVAGTISEDCRGEEGFGYDPLFVPTGEERSFAEMTSQEKNRISHRGRAVAAMVATLEPILEGESG